MNSTSKKVLFIIPTTNPGGIETYLLRFLIYIKNNELIEPILLVRNLNKGELSKEYEKLNIQIHYKPLGYFNIKNIITYLNLFKENKFDTICDFNANFAGIPVFLGKIVGVKNRITFYRQGKNHFKNNLFKFLYNKILNFLVYKYSTKILSNSKASIEFFFANKVVDDRFKVIYNGLDIESIDKINVLPNKLKQELNIPDNAFIVCHSGRLDKAKNHNAILNLAQKAIKQDSSIYFIICGLDTEKLNNKIIELGIQNNFRTLGYRKDIPQILKSSNLFYFPSFTEGQPNALIEAIICGLPFIASNIPPIIEIIPKEFNNLLVDPDDTDKALKLLFSIKNKENDNNFKESKTWASNFFSHNIRFLEFVKCL